MGNLYNLGPNKSFTLKSKVGEGTSIGFIIDLSDNDNIINDDLQE